jgi:hypothetical protein
VIPATAPYFAVRIRQRQFEILRLFAQVNAYVMLPGVVLRAYFVAPGIVLARLAGRSWLSSSVLSRNVPGTVRA